MSHRHHGKGYLVSKRLLHHNTAHIDHPSMGPLEQLSHGDLGMRCGNRSLFGTVRSTRYGSWTCDTSGLSLFRILQERSIANGLVWRELQ